MNPETRNREVVLRLLMAGLEGVTLDEAAEMLQVRHDRLARWLRGEETIPASSERRIRALHDILRCAHQLVKPESTRQWLFLSIPALGGRTPYAVATQGDLDALQAVAKSYVDPSFG